MTAPAIQRLLVITVTEDGEHYRVHASDGKAAEDVTDEFEVLNLVLDLPDGRKLAGFFVGRPHTEEV